MGGVAANRFDEIRDEVVAAVQFHINLSPGFLDDVAGLHQAVVGGDSPQNPQENQDQQNPDEGQQK